jgi:hypothetical protein
VLEDQQCSIDHSKGIVFLPFKYLLHYNNFISDTNAMSLIVAEILEMEKNSMTFNLERGKMERFLETLDAIYEGKESCISKQNKFFIDQKYLTDL